MATFCTVCGTKLEDGAGFCTQCGAKLESARPVAEAAPVTNAGAAENSAPKAAPVSAPAPAPAPQPRPAFAQNNLNQIPMPGSAYEPVSTGAFFGTLILLGIPLVGFIYSIVCAFGGCRKVNMRNFCRGWLILQIAGTLLAVILVVLLYVFVIASSGMSPDYFFEQLARGF